MAKILAPPTPEAPAEAIPEERANGARLVEAMEEFQASFRRDPGYSEEELADVIREELEAVRAEDREAEPLQKAV